MCAVVCFQCKGTTTNARGIITGVIHTRISTSVRLFDVCLRRVCVCAVSLSAHARPRDVHGARFSCTVLAGAWWLRHMACSRVECAGSWLLTFYTGCWSPCGHMGAAPVRPARAARAHIHTNHVHLTLHLTHILFAVEYPVPWLGSWVDRPRSHVPTALVRGFTPRSGANESRP